MWIGEDPFAHGLSRKNLYLVLPPAGWEHELHDNRTMIWVTCIISGLQSKSGSSSKTDLHMSPLSPVHLSSSRQLYSDSVKIGADSREVCEVASAALNPYKLTARLFPEYEDSQTKYVECAYLLCECVWVCMCVCDSSLSLRDLTHLRTWMLKKPFRKAASYSDNVVVLWNKCSPVPASDVPVLMHSWWGRG